MPQLQLGSIRNSMIVRESLRIAPVRPDAAAGLRAALATTLPLILAASVQRPELVWSGLAGFHMVLVDKGGAYRTRAISMAVLTAACALLIPLGMLSAEHTWLAVPLVLLVVGAGGFIRLLGAEASAIGVMMSVALVVALARPAHGVHEALSCAGFFVLGSAWAAGIALFLWPIRVYRPARHAVASALRALGAVATSFVDAKAEPDAQLARRAQLGAARQSIELARAALGASRRSRPGPTRRGQHLVALLEAADQLFAGLVALEDGLALEPPRTLPKLATWIDRAAGLIASELARCAEALEAEDTLVEAEAAEAQADRLANSIAPHAQLEGEYVPKLLARALELLDRVLINARVIDDPEAAENAILAEPSELSSEASLRSLLHDNWTLDSAMCRHALRMAITTAATLLLVHALALEHGYWATLTCLVIMQPHGAATWTKAMQRVLGTILGAGLATLVASLVHAPLALTACVFAFVALGTALLPLNYGAYAIFLTPGLVLLAEGHAGGLSLASVRIVNTLLGAVIALLGSRLLFPLAERDQFRPLMAAALRGLKRLLEIAASEHPNLDALSQARRGMGLALLNAEASYQRLLTEAKFKAEESEAFLSLLLYVHRLASGLIALALAEGTAAQRALAPVETQLMAALEDLTEAVTVGRPPAETGPRTNSDSSPRVALLFAQMDVLRSAVQRWHSV